MSKPATAPVLAPLCVNWHMSETRVRDLLSRMAAAAKAHQPVSLAADVDEDAEIEFYKEGRTAFIPIIGAITDYPCWLDEYCGLCPANVVQAQLKNALNDTSIEQIVLRIDSPGGYSSASGILAEAVAEANKVKPVWAVAQGLLCSAAYNIASRCRGIFAQASTEVGCIGTYCLLCDDSKFWEEMGVDWRLVSSGGVKGLGADGKVSQELIDDTQRIVTDLTNQFITSVATGRGESEDVVREWADGRVWLAGEAKTKGLIDNVASSEAAIQAISPRSYQMNLETFKAFAAEHPDAVTSYIEQGKKAGVAEGTTAERARATGILEAHGLKDHAATISLAAGHDVETAQTIASVAAKAKADAEATAKAQADAAKAENDRLTQALAKKEFEASGQRGVTTGGRADEKPANETTSDDPKAQAVAEWDAMDAAARKQWSSKDSFVAYRSAEISGRHRTMRVPVPA